MILEYADQSFQYLIEAQSYIDQYQEIDMYEAIFEAKNADVEVKIIQNEKSNDGAFASLKKAAKSVMDLIAGALKTIIGSIESLFSSKSDKENFARIKAAIEADPALANKPVRFFDFKHKTKEWQEIEAAAEDADRRLASGEDVDIGGIIANINKYTNSIGKGAVGTVAAQAAINACYGSKQFSKTLSAAMARDGRVMEEIENTLGKREAKKFKKEVNSLAKDNAVAKLFGKRINLKRELNKSRVQQCQTLEDSLMYTFRQLKNDVGKVAAATTNTKNNADLYVAGGFKNNVRRKINNAKMARDAAPLLKNDEVRRGVRTLGGNKDSREGIMQAANLAGRVNKFALDKRKDAHDAKKEREYEIGDYNRRTTKGDYSSQSLGSFVGGKRIPFLRKSNDQYRKSEERKLQRRNDLY